jgi:AsmA protein
MKNLVKIGLAVAIAVPILAAAAIHHFVDANTFRPIIEDRLSTALSRKVTLGNLSLSLTTGSLVANDLAIAEDPKFGQTPFFTAKRLHIGVQMKPLIFDKQLIVRSFEVDAPQIHLINAEDGTWNFSTLGHGASTRSTDQPAPLPDLPIGHITIKDGSARIDELSSQKKPQVYDHLNVRLDNFSLTKGFPFLISASLPGEGKVEISGNLWSINTQDAALTPLDAHLTIHHLDPVAAGYVDPGSGISMIAGLDAHIVSDGTNITSDGKIHAEHLILLKSGKAAPYPLDVTYKVGHSLRDNSGQVSDLALQTGAVAIHIQGTYLLTANVPVFDVKLLAPNVPIDGLRALLPAVGVKLPNGATLHGGTLSANFTMKGTAKDNVITGSYEIKNTRLVGYNLGSKIVGIAALGGIKTGDTTAIDVSRADVRITKAGSQSTNIYSNLPALGESTGSGTVSPSGQLNFHLISKVANAKGLNKVGINLLTKLNSTSAAAKPSKASGIPINITGTAENPIITADVNGLVKGNAAALRTKGADLLQKTGLANLFHKKKPTPPTR